MFVLETLDTTLGYLKKILMRSFSKYIRARVNFTADRYLGIKIEWILGGGLF